MPPSGHAIDANLLVLLAAGDTDPRIVERHRRLKGFSVEDYFRLRRFISDSGGVVYVTPNTLTEASNLLRQYAEPGRSELSDTLAALIHESRELIVLSADAAAHAAYTYVGLTDAALLTVISADRPLLTVDVLLLAEARRIDVDAAVDFRNL